MAAPARNVINMLQVKTWMLEAHEQEKEACGIVCGDTAFQLQNDATTPDGDFVVSGETLAAFFKEYPSLLPSWNGVWHSHPSGVSSPSYHDVQWHPMGKTLFVATDAGLHGHILAPEGGFQEIWREPWPRGDAG